MFDWLIPFKTSSAIQTDLWKAQIHRRRTVSQRCDQLLINCILCHYPKCDEYCQHVSCFFRKTDNSRFALPQQNYEVFDKFASVFYSGLRRHADNVFCTGSGIIQGDIISDDTYFHLNVFSTTAHRINYYFTSISYLEDDLWTA
jgi:hypothetical protein